MDVRTKNVIDALRKMDGLQRHAVSRWIRSAKNCKDKDDCAAETYNRYCMLMRDVTGIDVRVKSSIRIIVHLRAFIMMQMRKDGYSCTTIGKLTRKSNECVVTNIDLALDMLDDPKKVVEQRLYQQFVKAIC